MKVRGFAVAAVFLVGCAVGGVSSQLVVPKASAQQAATLTKWEVICRDENGSDLAEVAEKTSRDGNALGQQGWELSSASNQLFCWKRPKM